MISKKAEKHRNNLLHVFLYATTLLTVQAQKCKKSKQLLNNFPASIFESC